MEQYHFLLATEDDIPEIMKLYQSLVGTAGCAWTADYPNTNTAHSDIDSGSLYVLRERNRILAVATATFPDDLEHLKWAPKNPCELSRIGVIQAVQGRGIGTMMLQKMIASSKEKGYDGMILLASKTNPAALALYDKNGFERCGEVFMHRIHFYCYQMRFFLSA